MRSIEDTPPEERWLMATDVLSPRGVERLRKWVAKSATTGPVESVYQEQLQSFLEGDVRDCLTVFTLYAYADIPLGTNYDLVFDPETGRCEGTRLELCHAILHYGVAVPRLDHGHKYFCLFACPEGVPPLFNELPVSHDHRAIEAEQQIGLCMSSDWPAIRHNCQSGGTGQRGR